MEIKNEALCCPQRGSNKFRLEGKVEDTDVVFRMFFVDYACELAGIHNKKLNEDDNILAERIKPFNPEEVKDDWQNRDSRGEYAGGGQAER